MESRHGGDLQRQHADLERFGPDSSGAIYFVLRNPNTSASTVNVTVWHSDLGGTAARA